MKGVLLTIACVCVMFVLTGCAEKTALTADEFKNLAEGEGYTVIDSTSKVEQSDRIKKVYVAVNSGLTYQIEFWELSDVDIGVIFYNTNKENFENSKGSVNAETTINLGNYSKYTLSTNGKYKVIARVENTAIYANVDEEYKEEVKDFIEQLGY